MIELQGIVNQALALSFANNATFNQYRIKLQTALQDIRNEARSTSDLLSRCDLIRADFDTSDTIVTMKELIPRARDSENVSILAHTQKMREHYRVLNELTRKIQLASQTDPDLQVNNFVEGLARIPDVLQHIEAFAKPREVVFFKNGDKHNHLSDSLRIPKHARRDVRAANASSIDSAAAQTLKPQPAFVLNHKSPENNLSAFDIFTSASASSLNFNLEPMPGQQYWIERKGKPTLLRTSVKSIIAPSFSTNGHDHPGGRGSNTQSYSSRIKIPAFYDVLKSPAHVPIENFAFLFRDTVKPTLELKGWDSRFDEEIQNQKKRLVKIETKKKELHLDRELVFEELKKMNTEVERHLNSPLARFYRNGNNYQF